MKLKLFQTTSGVINTPTILSQMSPYVRILVLLFSSMAIKHANPGPAAAGPHGSAPHPAHT